MMTLEFVHIPKTGGTAIVSTYKECQWGRFGEESKVRQRLFHYDLKPWALPCSFWHNHTLVDALYKGSKTFCVFRDPMDRILSVYRFQGRLDNAFTFNTTLQQWKVELEKNPFFLDNHLAPQHLFAEQCDHVLLFDGLEKEVHGLVQQYGIAPRTLKKDNISIGRYHVVNNKNIISDKNMAWLRTYYAKDLEWYDRLKREKGM